MVISMNEINRDATASDDLELNEREFKRYLTTCDHQEIVSACRKILTKNNSYSVVGDNVGLLLKAFKKKCVIPDFENFCLKVRGHIYLMSNYSKKN